MEIKESPNTHTHYDPYGSPRKVIGTLVDCEDARAHNPRDSEAFADYMYMPRLVPSGSTGLPALVEQLFLAHYMMNRAKDTHHAITEALRVGDAWEVVITNLRSDRQGFHSERYRFEDGRVIRSVRNPHPPYPHEPPFCANCGY